MGVEPAGDRAAADVLAGAVRRTAGRGTATRVSGWRMANSARDSPYARFDSAIAVRFTIRWR